MNGHSGGLPIPPGVDPDDAGTLRPVDYGRVAEAARAWAATHHLGPACDDAVRRCLVLVDVQVAFCLPGRPLFVAGTSGRAAVDDNRRLARFIYRNLPHLTHVVATLDTHQAAQIFHPLFLVDDRGEPPTPFTVVTEADVAAGRWRVHPALAQGLGLTPAAARAYLRYYTRTLADRGHDPLTVWPYHALLGGVGHALAPVIEEAVFFHTVARMAPPELVLKGRHPLTEHYSAVGPEVAAGPDGAPLVPPDPTLPRVLADYDAVIVAGQAMSHCVAWTVADLLRAAPERAHRVYLLEDATSPIVTPAFDFTDAARAAFARFEAAGMHRVRTTDPLDTWPGMETLRAAPTPAP